MLVASLPVLVALLVGQGQVSSPRCEIFILPGCPIANAYSPEMARLARVYGSKVKFEIVIADPTTTPASAREHMRSFRLDMPAFVDRDGSRRRRSKATHSPQAVITLQNGHIVYSGRIDDRYASLGVKRASPQTKDLRNALESVTKGKRPKVASTPVVGCILPPVDKA